MKISESRIIELHTLHESTWVMPTWEPIPADLRDYDLAAGSRTRQPQDNMRSELPDFTVR